MLDTGKTKDLKEIAKWLNVTPPRVHQFLNLLRLAPAIQEDIMLSNDPTLFKIPEHKIRKIHIQENPAKQKDLWAELKHL